MTSRSLSINIIPVLVGKKTLKIKYRRSALSLSFVYISSLPTLLSVHKHYVPLWALGR